MVGKKESIPNGARLVGDDRHDARAELLVAHEVLEQPDERHRRGDLLLAGPFLQLRVGVVARQLQRVVLHPPRRHISPEGSPALEHVLDRLVVLARVVVRRPIRVSLELLVRDRDAHVVPEQLQVVQRHLLHLVGRVATGEVRAEAVALDRLGEDDRRLPVWFKAAWYAA
jgi:hypothetical protein